MESLTILMISFSHLRNTLACTHIQPLLDQLQANKTLTKTQAKKSSLITMLYPFNPSIFLKMHAKVEHPETALMQQE